LIAQYNKTDLLDNPGDNNVSLAWGDREDLRSGVIGLIDHDTRFGVVSRPGIRSLGIDTKGIVIPGVPPNADVDLERKVGFV
jgi:hypothetical protein